MIWVIIIASVGGLLLLAIARAPHEDPPPSGNASSADYLEALQKKQKEYEKYAEKEKQKIVKLQEKADKVWERWAE